MKIGARPIYSEIHYTGVAARTVPNESGQMLVQLQLSEPKCFEVNVGKILEGLLFKVCSLEELTN